MSRISEHKSSLYFHVLGPASIKRVKNEIMIPTHEASPFCSFFCTNFKSSQTFHLPVSDVGSGAFPMFGRMLEYWSRAAMDHRESAACSCSFLMHERIAVPNTLAAPARVSASGQSARNVRIQLLLISFVLKASLCTKRRELSLSVANVSLSIITHDCSALLSAEYMYTSKKNVISMSTISPCQSGFGAANAAGSDLSFRDKRHRPKSPLRNV
mmetsp:Transcript_48564/g.72425  ORF Transcript_48564/g.72425 Transcript_48564/m.72425 type:complete len:213 (-) Transcript_48564:5637-6275(-)